MAAGSIFWEDLRRTLWGATAGFLVGGSLFALYGRMGLWIALPALVLAASVASLVAGRLRRAKTKSVESPPFQVLSPLAREVVERLPDPLMLMDAQGRVLFANRAMREVLGVDVERKHVSSLLRTPAVLEALSRSSTTGEGGSIEFSFRVPVERYYQAYTARVSSDPWSPRCCCTTSRQSNAPSRCASISSPMPATNCARRSRPSPASSRR